jgi:hypothetical protein
LFAFFLFHIFSPGRRAAKFFAQIFWKIRENKFANFFKKFRKKILNKNFFGVKFCAQKYF